MTNNLRHRRRAPAAPDAGYEEITAGAAATRRELKKKTKTHSAFFWMMPSLIVCDGSQQGRQSGARNHNTLVVTSGFFFLHEGGETDQRNSHPGRGAVGPELFPNLSGEVHVITSERFPSTAQLITLLLNAED